MTAPSSTFTKYLYTYYQNQHKSVSTALWFFSIHYINMYVEGKFSMTNVMEAPGQSTFFID